MRLLIAGDHVHIEPEAARDIVGELPAVGGVTYGAGHHGERLVRARGLDQQVVFVEHGVLTRECVRCQPTAGVDPGAEPGHTADARELGGHLAVCDLRQVEPGGVRPDVDDGDAHVSQSKSWAGTW